MATVVCSRCTAERRGLRRELDSWRHRLIHCVGFESILEGIYGPLLLRDLNLFDDCEPEEVDDWSPESSCSQCSFCSLPLDKSIDQAPAASSPLSSPSDYSPCQALTFSESSQSAHRILQAVFHKKDESDVSLGCDCNIPQIAQELMKKMIHKFAMEYASKCLLHTNTNGVTRISSPLSETSDAPLDLRVSRTQVEKKSELEPDGVLDLSNRNSACSATSSSSANHKGSGSLLPLVTEELGDQRRRGTKFHQSSALGAVLSSLCPAHQSLLYRILKLVHHEKEKFRKETSTVLCPKRLHCTSCQSLVVSSPPLCQCHSPSAPSSNLCPSCSICCDRHSHHFCPCCSNHNCLTQVRKTVEGGIGDGDPPCPVLKREQSPSPPPLSPIPSDISKKTDDNPPSLFHHGQEEEADPIVENSFVTVSHQDADMNTATKDVQCKIPGRSQTEQNPSGTSLQDVMNRFNERLETISPLGKDRTLVSTAIYVSEKEQPLSPSTSQNLQFHADTNFTEIITTVLRTDSSSDYSLSELFSRHENKEPKLPNTRSRHRQKVLAAITTPPGDASTRRLGLKIKRDLAMLDQSCKRRKVSPAKKARLKDGNVTPTTSDTSADPNLIKAVPKGEMEVSLEPVRIHRVKEDPMNTLSEKSDRDAVKEDVHITKSDEKEKDIPSEEIELTLLGAQICTPELQCKYGKQIAIGDSIQKQIFTVSTASATGGEGCSSEYDRSHKESPASQISETENRPDNGADSHCLGKEREKCQSDHSKEARRSRRNIVPPQRFASYVTEPRNMFFVACISKPTFNHKAQKEKVSPSCTLHVLSTDPDARDTNLESKNEECLSSCVNTGKLAFQSTQKGQCELSCTDAKSQFQVSLQTVTPKDKSLKKCSSGNKNKNNVSDCAAPLLGRLRSSKRLQDSSKVEVPIKSDCCVESPKNSQIQYTSPIKLMFVSPVKDKEGVKYSLKSAGSGSGTQAEHFDPCEESSWSGTPQKHTSQSNKSATSQVKSVYSPLKSTTSRTRSSCSPTKSASSPASSPSKAGSSMRKSGSSPSKAGSSTRKSASSPSKSGSSTRKSASSPSKSGSSTPKCASSPTKSVPSPGKSGCSTPKCASSPAKSVPSPAKSSFSTPKSASSPRKSASLPRSASSSPKNGSRGSGEGTPTKRVAGTDSQGLPGNLPSFHEATPPKRRPGRPKKLGPQLEQKVKRPIGRPRKQKTLDSEIGVKTGNGKCHLAPEVEENVNKNLKITVVYGRSRRNKRTVSEGFDRLQTKFNDAWQAVNLLHNCKTSSGRIEADSEDLDFVSPAKGLASQSSSSIKCQRQDDSVRSRKPGRPAKVKISGISITVTTVSPRQRKIQINKETRQSPQTLVPKKVLLQELKSAKESLTISHQLMRKMGQKEEEESETMDGSKDELPNQPVAVRHSKRVRKPSIHFLHAVATSTSYSRSNALVRRSKQLLLNKANNERRQEEQQSNVKTSGEKRQSCGPEKKSISPDLSKVAGVSVDSIFTPKETLRWWAASAEEKTMNQELARRIRVISDTWVSDAVENQEKEMAISSKLSTKGNSLFTRNSKPSSVVRSLFDCSPNKPRSCSMQQICSWFMQTTETQSLAIVKKASSRNRYELMHFPRSANTKSVCHSPQAERLRKHIKKFAKMVPKTPLQHQKAQQQLRKRNHAPLSTCRRQLFMPSAARKFSQGVQQWRGEAFGRYQATLVRARTRFLTQKERNKGQKRGRAKKNMKVANSYSNERVVTRLQSKRKALCTSTKGQPSDCLENSSAAFSVSQTQEPVDVHKEQNLCSKAWGPETLKECRVFLRKINSPDSESAEEEWDSCTVTLEDGSPSAYVFAGRDRQLVGVVKAVKTERKRSINRRIPSSKLAGSAPKSVQDQEAKPAGRQKGKCKSPGVVSTEPPQPPPAKMLRQSRMRGLTGPRWCDFVIGN